MLTRPAPACQTIRRGAWIASRRRKRLNLNALSAFYPKRMPGLKRREVLPKPLGQRRQLILRHRRNFWSAPIPRRPAEQISQPSRSVALLPMKRQGDQALRLATPASVAPSVAEAPTAALRSDTSGKKNDRPARGTDWILSETTSPVDYSPLINAVIRATADVKDGPNTFAVRCRAQHTELSIRTDGAWAAPRGNDLLVDYQIDDRPVVRQPWILSTDGKTATYKNDPVELLQSIPEGATLKVAVADKGNVRREATFELTGLSGIRHKVGTACKWAPVTAKTSSEKR